MPDKTLADQLDNVLLQYKKGTVPSQDEFDALKAAFDENKKDIETFVSAVDTFLKKPKLKLVK